MDPFTAFLAWIKAAPKVAEVVTPEWDNPEYGGGAGGLAAFAEYQDQPLTYEEWIASGLPIPAELRDYYEAQAAAEAATRGAATGTGKGRGATERQPFPGRLPGASTGTGTAVAAVALGGAVILTIAGGLVALAVATRKRKG